MWSGTLMWLSCRAFEGFFLNLCKDITNFADRQIKIPARLSIKDKAEIIVKLQNYDNQDLSAVNGR